MTSVVSRSLQKIATILTLAIFCLGLSSVFAQHQDTEKANRAAKKGPKSTIVIRPGPPVKPTQAAKPNGNQKSDWGNSANLKR